MIPKIIWQTYKDDYDSLPEYIKFYTTTWIGRNPEYEYKYFNDIQAAEFVKEHYGQEYYDIFVSLPFGVMRGDMFRYLCIYKFGGVYADLDTVCENPIDNWILEEYDMIICPENESHLCQWTFAAAPNNPLIKSVIDLMIERLKSPNFDMPHAVHYHTGPSVWTEGILRGLGVFGIQNDLTTSGKFYNELEEAKNNKLYLYSDNRWRIFHFEDVRHLYGSQNWHEGYVRWITQVK